MATITISTDTNYTASGHADNDGFVLDSGAVLTIDSDTNRINDITITEPGEILIKNTSTTTPIFVNCGVDSGTQTWRIEGAGKTTIEGERISVGTSDGTASQTFTLPTSVGGKSYDEVCVLEVKETGKEPVLYGRVDTFTDLFSDDTFGTFFLHDTATDTITFGDGTNGYIPPNGADVSVANIQIQSTNTGAGYTVFDTNSSGTIAMENCLWGTKMYPNFSSASSTTLKSVGFWDVGSTGSHFINLASQSSPPILERVYAEGYYSILLNFSGTNDPVMKSCFFYCSRTSGARVVYMVNGSGGLLENTRVMTPHTSPHPSIFAMAYITSPGAYIKDCHFAGATNALVFEAGTSGCLVEGGTYNPSGKYGGDRMDTVAYLTNTSDNIIDGFDRHFDIGRPELTSPTDYIFNTSTGTKNNIWANTNPYCGASPDIRVNSLMYNNGKENKIYNWTVYGDFSNSTIIGNTAINKPITRNIFVVDAQSSTAKDCGWGANIDYEYMYVADRLSLSPYGTGAGSVSVITYRPHGDRSSGRLIRAIAAPVDEGVGYYEVVTQTGKIAFDNEGYLRMDTIGDEVILYTKVHKGITGFTSALAHVSGSFTREVSMRNPDGVWSPYFTYDNTGVASAFSSLTDYDSNDGIQVRIKVTRDGTGLTDFLGQLYQDVTLDPSYRPPAEVYPAKATFKNLAPGDVVYVEDGGEVTKLSEVSDGSDIELVLPNANEGESWTYIIKRAGYTHTKGSILVERSISLSIPFAGLERKRAGGDNMYTNTTTPGVVVEFIDATPQANIRVGDVAVEPQTMFDMFEDALATEDGAKWLARQGSGVSFDNLPGVGNILFLEDDIRIIRDEATDANAALSGYAVSTQATPIDGSNGSVGFVGGSSGGGLDEAELHTALDNYTNKDDYKAEVPIITDIKGKFVQLEGISMSIDEPIPIDIVINN